MDVEYFRNETHFDTKEEEKGKLSLIKFLFETIRKMGRRNQNSRAKQGMANYIPLASSSSSSMEREREKKGI